jgi:hypothetical protein
MVEIYTPIPKSTSSGEEQKLSQRLTNLNGKRVALLSNKKANATEVLMRTGQLLKEMCHIKEFDLFEKENASFPAPEKILNQIVNGKYDAAVVSLGD